MGIGKMTSFAFPDLLLYFMIPSAEIWADENGTFETSEVISKDFVVEFE